MSIRLKLLLSYTGMLVISLAMFVVTALLFTVVSTGDIRNFRDFYKLHYQLNPLTEQEESIFLELKYLAKNDPVKLLDQKLMREYDYELRSEKAGLYIRRESNHVYESITLVQPEFYQGLPPYDLDNNQIRSTFYIGERFYAYAKFDFKYADGAKGSLFVFRERSPFVGLTRRLLPVLILILAGVLVVANVLLHRWITRSVVKPLNKLRSFAERIEDGNLQFKLDLHTKDEIGKLNEAFEKMRQRLQDSVNLRLQYEENRKELISNISHDLRTPITNIKGYIEGIRDGVADTPEKMETYVNIIYAKAVDMDKLVDELFLYSKLDIKQEPFTMDHVDLARFLDDFTEELQFDLEKKNVKLEWNRQAHESVEVVADLEKIKRTLLNIIENALKYSNKPDKKIRISLQADSDWATVEIKDNGIGISAEAVPHIFERFYRTELSRNSSTGGSGLGLAIARQIIEAHGGRIWAESEPGAGTSLFFTLKRTTDLGGVGRHD